MLKTAQALRNIVTIYHNPTVESSVQLVKFATQKFQKLHRFDLQVEEGNPTADQLNTLKTFTPMLATIKKAENLPRPTLVSWFNGKVAVENEQRAHAIINALEAEASDKN